jgi:hypothetical protein
MVPNTIPEVPPFQLKRITVVEVNKYIRLLNKGKATGPDGISNMILQCMPGDGRDRARTRP